jgi:putative molybdopterin biosynthesis protein
MYATKDLMESAHLYHQIAKAIRQQIRQGELKPGERLPTVRQMTLRWKCTIGTVQRAYQELAAQGLVISRAGQGTRVVESLPPLQDAPLRRAALVHRAESFLLEVLTAGYAPAEVEDAVRQALERWRVVCARTAPAEPHTLRFSGSHDLAVAWLAAHFAEIAPGYTLQLSFSGSLGGLIALAEGQAELAGCHLWDAESDSYNLPFIKRLLPGQRLALVTLAQRRIGLIVPPGNPQGVLGLGDLARPGLRLANRQPGSGTRVWLDAQLRRQGIDAAAIPGYGDEKATHSQVAQAVAEGQAQVGLGLEAAGRAYGLDFIELALETYHLVIPQAIFETPPLQALLDWLAGEGGRQVVGGLAGYEVSRMGKRILLP